MFSQGDVQDRESRLLSPRESSTDHTRSARLTLDLPNRCNASEASDLGRDEADRTYPSRQDFIDLPHVADKLPYGAFLVAIVELCERFAYYGLSGPLQNYISNAYKDPSGLPGALGLGQSSATAITNLFQFWCYFTPILGAIISDQYLGKYATIKWSSTVYMAGIAILFVSSLPWSIESGAALPGLIAAMVIIGLGTGGIKSNVSPLIAEQVRSNEPVLKTLSNGNRVIVDPELTVQRIYMVFYMCKLRYPPYGVFLIHIV